MKKHSLRMLDEDIRIISDKDEDYVESLRTYILSTIKKYDDVNTPFPMPFLNKALYACVFLTDELFKERQNVAELKEQLETLEKLSNKGKGKQGSKN